jgi:hypothetical protein
VGDPDAEAVNVIVACVFPGTADTFVGADGTGLPAGVTEFEADEADEVPTPLIATTVNV